MSADRTLQFMYKGRKHTLKYRDSDHSYRVSVDGGPSARYVGNSTISKVAYMDPGGLMMYSRNETLAGRDYRETTKFTQDCGNAAHDQLEALGKTGKALDLSDQPERVRGALSAVAKWWLEVSPTFKATEVIVCSPELRVAGRFDFLAEVDGELILGDLKTTTDSDWEHFRKYKAQAAFVQLAGYAVCYRAMFPHLPQPTGRYILRAGMDGEYDFRRDFAPTFSEKAFLSKVQNYRDDAAWSKAYDGGVKAAQMEFKAA